MKMKQLIAILAVSAPLLTACSSSQSTLDIYNKFLKKHIVKFTDKDNNDESEDDTDK